MGELTPPNFWAASAQAEGRKVEGPHKDGRRAGSSQLAPDLSPAAAGEAQNAQRRSGTGLQKRLLLWLGRKC